MGGSTGVSMARDKRPNFLFFIADQLRFDHLGCYGNGVVRTPTIDALAAQGFVADRFYVASPICMPNRATLMTGRMPSLHGVRHNGIRCPCAPQPSSSCCAAPAAAPRSSASRISRT